MTKAVERDIVVVTGCTRSGTSLTMQALEAGGYPVYGTFPAYEEMKLGEFPDVRSCAVKCPDSKYWDFPMERIRVVYCTRNREVQAASLVRWMDALGMRFRGPKCVLEESIVRDDLYALERFEAAGVPVLQQTFESLVEDTAAAMDALAAFVDPLMDVARMFTAVRPRTAGLYPTLLEVELIGAKA